MNQYPLWKNLLIVMVIAIGALYAAPNLFGDDPSVQISSSRSQALPADLEASITTTLNQEGIDFKAIEADSQRLLVRLENTDQQIRSQEVLSESLGRQYVTALNLAPATPGWLRAMGAVPMVLGLDLQGGVHFLMEVDMQTAERQQQERVVDEVRTALREAEIRYQSVTASGRSITAVLRNAEQIDAAASAVARQNPELSLDSTERNGDMALVARITDDTIRELRQRSIEQNIVTLRNRVNELGVAEPIVQQQGEDRIVVQLPGVQDTVQAKRIIGATATLEYRAVDTENDAIAAANSGRIPPTSRLYYDRNGQPVLLKKRLIVSGDQLIGANSGFDPTTGSPMVSVTLDSAGARRMFDFTTENVGKPMAVLYIEDRYDPELGRNRRVEEVISVANIREPFGKRFQTTGLGSSDEAANLALFLRAGALAAPVRIVEERTIGPSLGQENIDKGFMSVVIGFALVLVFMALYYKMFGLFANVALMLNLVLIVSVLSMFGATLTLPGIAGIVLTVGMAVDANVLVFERIREELRNGNSPQNSIRSGYDKAFSTIADANVTTLIASIALFAFGTGPIKGFAVTLSIGILTSMFTAILVTRALVNKLYGQRKQLKALAI